MTGVSSSLISGWSLVAEYLRTPPFSTNLLETPPIPLDSRNQGRT